MTSSVACAAGRGLPALWLLAALAATTAQSAPRETVVSGDDGQPLADAVVAVELRGAGAVARPGGSVETAQRQRRFEPGLLVVQTGRPARRRGARLQHPRQDGGLDRRRRRAAVRVHRRRQRARLELPPGAHRVRLWHASLRETMQEQTLQADGPMLALRPSARP